MRRRMLIALVLAALGAVATHPHRAGGAGARCSSASIRPHLATQGTATQAVVLVLLSNPGHARCTLSESARFEIEQNGRRASIAHNPLTTTITARLRGQTTGIARPDVWWGNWCGSRHGLRVVVTVGERTISAPFQALPVCLDAHRPSALSTA
jgi:hypothetical protein